MNFLNNILNFIYWHQVDLIILELLLFNTLYSEDLFFKFLIFLTWGLKVHAKCKPTEMRKIIFP